MGFCQAKCSQTIARFISNPFKWVFDLKSKKQPNIDLIELNWISDQSLIATINDLEKESVLAIARLQVAQTTKNIPTDCANEVLNQLIDKNLIPLAISLARSFDINLSQLIENLTNNYVSFERNRFVFLSLQSNSQTQITDYFEWI